MPTKLTIFCSSKQNKTFANYSRYGVLPEIRHLNRPNTTYKWFHSWIQMLYTHNVSMWPTFSIFVLLKRDLFSIRQKWTYKDVRNTHHIDKYLYRANSIAKRSCKHEFKFVYIKYSIKCRQINLMYKDLTV